MKFKVCVIDSTWSMSRLYSMIILCFFFLLWRVCFKEDILHAFCLDKKRKVGYFLDTVQAMSINFNMNITFSELYPYASSMTLTLCQGQIVVGNVN